MLAYITIIYYWSNRGDLVHCCEEEHVVSIYVCSLIFLLLLVSIFFTFESTQLCELYILLLKLCSICIRSRIYHYGELLSFNLLGCTALSFSGNYLDVWKEKSNLFMHWTPSKNRGTFMWFQQKGFWLSLYASFYL